MQHGDCVLARGGEVLWPGSNLLIVKEEHLNTRVVGCINSTVRSRRLSLGACERFFHRVEVVEMHRPNQINIG